MIKRLICAIFGHQMIETVFTGKYGTVPDYLFGLGQVQVPIMKKVKAPFCLRCGKELE